MSPIEVGNFGQEEKEIYDIVCDDAPNILV